MQSKASRADESSFMKNVDEVIKREKAFLEEIGRL